MITDREVVAAEAMRMLSDELCRLTARLDQLSAAHRDAWTPCANLPDLKGDSQNATTE